MFKNYVIKHKKQKELIKKTIIEKGTKFSTLFSIVACLKEAYFQRSYQYVLLSYSLSGSLQIES